MYLDAQSRLTALALSQSLQRAHELFQAGERQASVLERAMQEILTLHPGLVVEYIAIADPDHLRPVEQVDGTTVVALAARVGTTRLIDNIALGQGIR